MGGRVSEGAIHAAVWLEAGAVHTVPTTGPPKKQPCWTSRLLWGEHDQNLFLKNSQLHSWRVTGYFPQSPSQGGLQTLAGGLVPPSPRNAQLSLLSLLGGGPKTTGWARRRGPSSRRHAGSSALVRPCGCAPLLCPLSSVTLQGQVLTEDSRDPQALRRACLMERSLSPPCGRSCSPGLPAVPVCGHLRPGHHCPSPLVTN